MKQIEDIFGGGETGLNFVATKQKILRSSVSRSSRGSHLSSLSGFSSVTNPWLRKHLFDGSDVRKSKI